MLFFREIAFDKYLNKRRHIIRLFTAPVGILVFLIAMLSILSATAKVEIQHERCLLYGLTIAIASAIWVLTHIMINYFLTSNKWELNFKNLWRFMLFSFLGTSSGVFISLYKDSSTGLYPVLLFIISILLFVTAIFGDYGQFNIKILKVFEEFEKNLKDVNKSVIESTIKKAQKIIKIDRAVSEAILNSELKTRIYIESLKIADTVLAKECEKRTRHTDNESAFIDSVTKERTDIQNILESKDINKHIGGQDLRTLLWNLANNLGQLDAENEDVNSLRKDAGKELSRLAELVTIKGEYKGCKLKKLVTSKPVD
jgi:hypothetical protein